MSAVRGTNFMKTFQPIQFRFIQRNQLHALHHEQAPQHPFPGVIDTVIDAALRAPDHGRSEEHTSELQSPCNLVCRLLLEKKNTTPTADHTSSRRRTVA